MSWWTIATIAEVAWVVFMGLGIILARRSPVATIAWIVVLAWLPLFGVAIYFFFGPRRLKRRTLRRAAGAKLLAHADIVSLLATGTTTADLGGNAEALASRAAILAVKQLYRKVFKRGAPPPTTTAAEDANLLNRFDVELGSTDNRTGQQQVVARFKFNDQLYFVGEAGVDGQVTGRLKYLIRFR